MAVEIIIKTLNRLRDVPKDIKLLFGKRVVILGAKGSGKTSFLRMLQKKEFTPEDPNTPWPVPFDCFVYSSEYEKRKRFFTIWRGEDTPGESGGHLQWWRNIQQLKKKCVVFFIVDSFGYLNDEVLCYYTEEPRSEKIRKLTNAYLDLVLKNANGNPICLVFSHLNRFESVDSTNKIDLSIREIMSKNNVRVEECKSFCADLTDVEKTLRPFENYLFKQY